MLAAGGLISVEWRNRRTVRRTVRAILVLLAGSTFVICGVKGPPHPPVPEVADAGAVVDGGAP